MVAVTLTSLQLPGETCLATGKTSGSRICRPHSLSSGSTRSGSTRTTPSTSRRTTPRVGYERSGASSVAESSPAQGRLASRRRLIHRLDPIEGGACKKTSSNSVSFLLEHAYGQGCVSISECSFDLSHKEIASAWGDLDQVLRSDTLHQQAAQRRMEHLVQGNRSRRNSHEQVEALILPSARTVRTSVDGGHLGDWLRQLEAGGQHAQSAISEYESSNAGVDEQPCSAPSSEDGEACVLRSVQGDSDSGSSGALRQTESRSKLLDPRDREVCDPHDQRLPQSQTTPMATFGLQKNPSGMVWSPAALRRRRRLHSMKSLSNNNAPKANSLRKFHTFMKRRQHEERRTAFDQCGREVGNDVRAHGDDVNVHPSSLAADGGNCAEGRATGFVKQISNVVKSGTQHASDGSALHGKGGSHDGQRDEIRGLDHKRLLGLTKKYPVTPKDIINYWQSWVSDKRADQSVEYMTLEEFKDKVRKAWGFEQLANIPMHILQMGGCPAVDRGYLTFEEFVQWSMQSAFASELVVRSRVEHEMRKIAREFDMPITDIEAVRKVFIDFDTDGSGEIEEEEFKKIILKLMKVQNESDISQERLKRYWRQVDTDGGGTIGFSEFLIWYIREFPEKAMRGGPSSFKDGGSHHNASKP